jgi:hypothetical protein
MSSATLSVRRAVQFLVVIFFTIIGSLIISYFVFLWVLPNQRADLPSVRPEALQQRQLPPEPRVQGFPMRDWENFIAEETRKTTTYELVDETAGKARIPSNARRNLFWSGGCNR